MSKNLIKKILKEEFSPEMVVKKDTIISESLKYHLENKMTLRENIFRPYTKSFFNLIEEVRTLYSEGKIELCESDVELVKSDLGKKVVLESGKVVYLDCPFEENSPEQTLIEAEYKGRKVQLNKPMRNTGSGKKYFVYVKNPSTKKIKKISFGDVKGGLTAKVSNPEARKRFATRHNCKEKKDKMKAGYWACRVNRYAHLWGNRTYPGYW